MRDAEVRDEPEGSGSEGGSDAVDEEVEFGLGEAVKEEVGDDQVVRAFEWEGERAVVVGAETSSGVGSCCFATLALEFEHGGAGIDDVGVEMRIVLEELGEETAVSVTQDQGVAAIEEIREVVIAAVFEGTAEREVFEPAIRFSDGVEVGFSSDH